MTRGQVEGNGDLDPCRSTEKNVKKLPRGF